MEIGLRICNNKDCELKGQPQLINNFYKKGKGITNQCKNCIKNRINKHDSEHKQEKQIRNKIYNNNHKKEKKEYNVKYKKKNKKELFKKRQIINKSPKRKYRDYNRSAKRRNIEFNLIFEEFMTFWQKPCHYCGYDIKTIGLDRKDNDRGYILSNVVSCCYGCNSVKSNLFTYEEMINYLAPAILGIKLKRSRQMGETK